VRYYGGIKLGVGGLINAYRTAAKEAIKNTTIIEDEERNLIEVLFTYEAMPFVMNEVKNSDCKIIEQDFQTSPRLKLSVPTSNFELITQLKKLGKIVELNENP
jgi:putative IMPACT (imprinted ancient) family translation regulator